MFVDAVNAVKRILVKRILFCVLYAFGLYTQPSVLELDSHIIAALRPSMTVREIHSRLQDARRAPDVVDFLYALRDLSQHIMCLAVSRDWGDLREFLHGPSHPDTARVRTKSWNDLRDAAQTLRDVYNLIISDIAGGQLRVGIEEMLMSLRFGAETLESLLRPRCSG